MTTLERLLKKAKRKIPDFHEEPVTHAYEFAKKHHGDKLRLNGQTESEHCLEVAEILVDYYPQEEVIIAALLHCIPQNSPTIYRETEKAFGKDVSGLLQGMQALSSIKAARDYRQMDSLRNMFLSMAKDVRVAIMSIADHLHNMKSLEFLPPDVQKEVSQEALYIYAPVASRLGMFALKAPLEDMAFFYLLPKEHKKLSQEMNRYEIHRDRIIDQAKKNIEGLLQQNSIQGSVNGRIKHLYGVYKKLQKKRRDSVEEIFDIFAMRIIVPSILDCYTMLGVIHEKFVPLANRFKDYIAVPKPNGYRSLHTTVVGLSGETKKAFPIEIQIRTQEMNEEAEYGIAAHWHYKEQESKSKEMTQKSKEWVESLLEIQEHLKDNQDFIKGSGGGISGPKRVYAITPGGDIKDLPKGATPIDFAFAVHSHIGLRMRLAKANGVLVPLDYQIQNGDVIEVVTSRDAKPNQNWLSLCVSSRTKSRLRSYFHSKDNDTLIRDGRDMLNKQLVQHGLDELDQSLSVLKEYAKSARNKREREIILHRIGNGSVSPVSVAKEIAVRLKKEHVAHTPQKKKLVVSSKDKKEVGIIIGENRNIPTKNASCCNPKPGDKIVGFVTRGNHITIHRTDCKTLAKLDSRRLLDARYETDEPMKKICIEVKRGADRVGFVNDILSIFSQKNMNLAGFVFEQRNSHSATLLFTVETEREQKAADAIPEIEKVESVKSAQVREGK